MYQITEPMKRLHILSQKSTYLYPILMSVPVIYLKEYLELLFILIASHNLQFITLILQLMTLDFHIPYP